MAPVAVTGATGLIGSAVVRHLVAAGRDVRALVEPGARAENLDDLPGARVDRVTADVTDAAGMRRALDGCEALYHLAAVYKVWAPDPSIIHRVNVEGTLTTLLAAQAAGVRRIVHTSSIAAVGLRDDGRPSDETCAFNLWPIANAYVLSKHLSERVAMNAAAAGLPVVVVNPGFPFGPGDRAPTPTGRIVLSVLKGEVPATSAGGFAAIDVDDCAAGHLAAEERGRVGERYLLVNHNVTFHDFVTEVARRAGVHGPRVRVPRQAAWALGLAYELVADHVTHVEPPATYRAVRYATRDAFFDNAKARRELSLPTRPLTETIDRAIAFFRATGMDRALPNFAIERAGRGNALARMSRTYLVTGANTGIGRVTAEELARKGGRVFLACRSKDKTMPVIEGIRAAGGFAEFVPLDLADLASVRACAADFLARKEPLHVLVNNAGLAGLRGLTKDGFELTFGTNHLGHFLLTKLLLPLLQEAEDARIVNVSSKSHYRAKGIDWDALRKPTATTTGLPEYEVSKLANVLFTKELSRRLGGKVHSYALHPGVVASDAWRQIPWGIRHVMKLFMITNEDGAKTTLHCATSPDVKDHDGRYYDSCKERKPSKLSEDAALAKELWERSEAWVAGLSSSVAPRSDPSPNPLPFPNPPNGEAAMVTTPPGAGSAKSASTVRSAGGLTPDCAGMVSYTPARTRYAPCGAGVVTWHEQPIASVANVYVAPDQSTSSALPGATSIGPAKQGPHTMQEFGLPHSPEQNASIVSGVAKPLVHDVISIWGTHSSHSHTGFADGFSKRSVTGVATGGFGSVRHEAPPAPAAPPPPAPAPPPAPPPPAPAPPAPPPAAPALPALPPEAAAPAAPVPSVSASVRPPHPIMEAAETVNRQTRSARRIASDTATRVPRASPRRSRGVRRARRVRRVPARPAFTATLS